MAAAKRYTAEQHDATGATTTGPRYGWLGGKQRATDTGTTGLTLMGVRLYAPVLGRFLSTDPVYDGNANSYVYPGDPINRFDLDGRDWRTWVAGAAIVAGVVGAIACGISIICGVAVGAASAAAYYAARNAGTRRFSWGGMAASAAGGAVFGRFGQVGRMGFGRWAAGNRQIGLSSSRFGNTQFRGFTGGGRLNNNARRIKLGWTWNPYHLHTFRVGYRAFGRARHITLF
jgi:RHS repeat-associated protein